MKNFSAGVFSLAFLLVAGCENKADTVVDAVIPSYTVGGTNGTSVTVQLEDTDEGCVLLAVSKIGGADVPFEINSLQFATEGSGTGGWDYQDRENTPILIPDATCQSWLDYVGAQGGGTYDAECGYYRIAGPQDPITFRNDELFGNCIR